MVIEVLLLDFGGVCMLHPFELHGRTESLLGLTPGTITWRGSVDPSTDELWREVVAGEISERTYFDVRARELGDLAGRAVSRAAYFAMLYEPPTPAIIRTQATDIVIAAREAGYGVSILTNDLAAFQGPTWHFGVEFFDLIDHVVDCSTTGVFKPERRAFQHAQQVIGARASQILFVDDQSGNVEGASAAGMESLWFDVSDAQSSWEAVGRRLGLTPAP